MAKEKQTFWETVGDFFKAIGRWIVRYPLALLASVAIILVAVLFMFAGKGDKFNWGGIISRLFGRDEETYSKVEIANQVPEDREQEKGETDDRGFVQMEVQPLETSSNPFRDKSKIKVEKDGETETIKLPEGVKDSDVQKIYRTESGEYKIKVKEKPEDKDLGSLKDSLS